MAGDNRDPRINVIIHQDFKNHPQDLLSQLKGATGCVWALGISQTKVDADRQGFSNATAGEPFDFVYVSGSGATTTPGRFSALFARLKGEAEMALAGLLRPAFIDVKEHSAIKPARDGPTLKAIGFFPGHSNDWCNAFTREYSFPTIGWTLEGVRLNY
ncbi:hypothetical protein UA08_08219 [Talaromyces atroroseus]|uniref:Uncharacterized protein n=1 Tax=Talaromyces atroroseus TaxID=1441469 RepID=A0A225A762_TALAT|nr:hypothetical protein UA08_08219 [Talaromyces atroroseus]OKL56451.1 hypothetical protein UA08_08219 [Talaromyces atroroseus]